MNDREENPTGFPKMLEQIFRIAGPYFTTWHISQYVRGFWKQAKNKSVIMAGKSISFQ